MNKVEKNGEVAVLYSPGFGAPWSALADGKQKETLCMDARIVQPVLDGDIPKAVAVALELFPDFYTGGADNLKVQWIPKGYAFEIWHYDGSESIRVVGERDYLVA